MIRFCGIKIRKVKPEYEKLRKEKNISQAVLAKQLDVSFAVVCYWETDRSEPTAPNLLKLADYFDVSADYLLGRIDSY